MGDSIARGVAATAEAAGWLILPGDLPLISSHTLKQVARSLLSHTVVLPRWQGRRGHPVGFGAACQADLLALCGDVGASAVVRKYQRLGQLYSLAVNDPGIAMDIDTPADLQRAESMLRTSFSIDKT